MTSMVSVKVHVEEAICRLSTQLAVQRQWTPLPDGNIRERYISTKRIPYKVSSIPYNDIKTPLDRTLPTAAR